MDQEELYPGYNAAVDCIEEIVKKISNIDLHEKSFEEGMMIISDTLKKLDTALSRVNDNG